MPVIAAALEKQSNRDITCSWTPLANGDTGAPLFNPENRFATVQVTGTFGVGASISIEGSLNGIDWITLQDSSNAAITLTAAGMVTVRDMVKYIRPNVTAGDGTTALTCVVLAR
jgi:hypothetical protein